MSRRRIADAVQELVAPLITHAGGEALWVVGGTVRDVALGTHPKDVDLASARAGQLAASFAAACGSRPVALGENPTTWRVPCAGQLFDFAPLQGENIEEDLARRDFTLNAIACSVGSDPAVIDPFDGLTDIERRILRCVRESNLDDDPLRALRGVRFAVTLDFEFDRECWRAVCARSGKLATVAPERAQYEFARILEHDPARGADLLTSAGMDLPLLGRAIDQEAIGRLRRASMSGLSGADRQVLALTLLSIGDSPAEFGERLLDRRWPRRTRDAVVHLASALQGNWDHPEAKVLEIQSAGERLVLLLGQALAACDRTSEATQLSEFAASRAADWWSMRPLLAGDEVVSITGVAGAEIGRILSSLLEAQLQGRVTTLDQARQLVAGLTRSE